MIAEVLRASDAAGLDLEMQTRMDPWFEGIWDDMEWAILHGYVKLPEGIHHSTQVYGMSNGSYSLLTGSGMIWDIFRIYPAW